MRRFLDPVVGYAARCRRALAGGWDAFWFTPADPTLLGLLRVLTGLMLLYTHAVWGLALDAFFGPTSWLNPGLVRALQADQYAYSFWWWVPAGWTWPAHAAALVLLALFALGLWTRVTSCLALVVAISYAHRVPAALFGLDQINVMLTLYLAIGPSGDALSVDRWRARRRRGAAAGPAAPSVGANLAQRLIQVHMCVIYSFAGISKLQGPAWWDGEAMWLALANLEYQTVDMTWLAWYPWLLNVATHVSVLWEISFCVLIWRPLWRPLVLAGAVALHVGIGAFLGMWTFGLIMLVGCASFLPNEAVRRLVASLAPVRAPERSSEGLLTVLPLGTLHRVDRHGVPEAGLAADGGGPRGPWIPDRGLGTGRTPPSE
jgi:Vitamin K-dependent gamma-carboxylase